MIKQRTVTMDEELWEAVQTAIYSERERLNQTSMKYTELLRAKDELLSKLGKASGLISRAGESEQ